MDESQIETQEPVPERGAQTSTESKSARFAKWLKRAFRRPDSTQHIQTPVNDTVETPFPVVDPAIDERVRLKEQTHLSREEWDKVKRIKTFEPPDHSREEMVRGSAADLITARVSARNDTPGIPLPTEQAMLERAGEADRLLEEARKKLKTAKNKEPKNGKHISLPKQHPSLKPAT